MCGSLHIWGDVTAITGFHTRNQNVIVNYFFMLEWKPKYFVKNEIKYFVLFARFVYSFLVYDDLPAI